MLEKKRYYWTRADEAKLLGLWKKGVTDFALLGKELGRQPRAIEMKLKRLGVVVLKPPIRRTTTMAVTDEDLLTHKQALRVLARAWERPYHGEFVTELNVERFELRKDGSIALNHPSGTHDDVFWAVCLALYSTVEMVEEPEVWVVPR